MKLESRLLTTSVIEEHPCFDEGASHIYGRIHLPVAPRCNIQCNYCDRRYDCVNESRPGVTSRVISPQEAAGRVEEAVRELPVIRVVGIAGPGDPLFNEGTFETFRLVGERFPFLHKCMSTNGLLLPEKVKALRELGLDAITVTLNTVEPAVGARIYAFVYYQGRRLEGVEGAEVLLSNQLTGIEMAVREGMVVKVNTVMIPGINDDYIIGVARKAKELGVYVQNIMPLIPLSRFANISPPSPDDVEKVRAECGRVIKQVGHCRRCRADAVGLLHRDMSVQLFGQCGG